MGTTSGQVQLSLCLCLVVKTSCLLMMWMSLKQIFLLAVLNSPWASEMHKLAHRQDTQKAEMNLQSRCLRD